MKVHLHVKFHVQTKSKPQYLALPPMILLNLNIMSFFTQTIDALHKGLNNYPHNILFMDNFAIKLHCHFHIVVPENSPSSFLIYWLMFYYHIHSCISLVFMVLGSRHPSCDLFQALEGRKVTISARRVRHLQLHDNSCYKGFIMP